MGNELFETGKKALGISRGFLLRLLEDLEGEQLVARAGGVGNHALWVVGHLANTDESFLTSMAGKPRTQPESWGGLFGMGSTPTDSLAAYPAVDEVFASLHSTRESLLAWMGSLSPDELVAPLPEELARFAPHKAGLLSSLAFHEGVHAGQVTTVRSSLGIGRAMS